MQAPVPSPLVEWSNFYVIIGSSAGALTGLQFVVIALVAQAQATGSMLEIRAFGSPTVVHFCAALLISAILSAPWHTLPHVGLALGLCGGAGVIYALSVIRHASRTTGYRPDTEDWMWYVVLPLGAYTALLISGIEFATHATSALFEVATISLVLLFIGIHNAWDTVTYVAVKHLSRRDVRKE